MNFNGVYTVGSSQGIFVNTLEACEKLLGKCSHLFKWQVLRKKQQKRMERL